MNTEREIDNVHYDSRKIKAGDTFICLPKGETYISDAKKRGASKVVSMTRTEMAAFSDQYYGYPSQQCCVIGITGTNGKTTTAYLVHHALLELGYKSKFLGTLNSELTTPESLDIQRLIKDHIDNDGTHFIMEVSSHGIDQGRVLNIDFDVKLLTNISQDHLDYHHTLEAYQKVKEDFVNTYPGKGIFPSEYQGIQYDFKNPLLGQFNEDNMKAAIALLRAIGVSETDLTVLKKATPPPGRFETIDEGQPYTVIVDYAHTPDSLENVLITIKGMKETGRVLTVFGCGGDRDRGKRSQMGQIAVHLSDYVIITSDNPRTEPQSQITGDILQGITKQNYDIVEERGLAIQQVIQKAQPNDVVLIAGKGHETYQILKDKTIDFDDRIFVRRAIQESK